MSKYLSITMLLTLLVFAGSAAVIWLAHGAIGDVVINHEPPLIKASATPLKIAPEDPGGREVADLGGVGALLSDQPGVDREERLLPRPEQPLTPAEVAVRNLGTGQVSDAQRAGAEERAKAREALDALIAEINQGAGERSDLATHQPELAPSPPAATVATSSVRSVGSAQQISTETVDDPLLGTTQQASLQRPASLQRDGTGEAGSEARAIEAAVFDQERDGNGDARFQGTPGGRFRVQLAAVRQEEDAKRAWAMFKEQLGPFMIDVEPFFERAETDNGTFFRVQIGPFAENSTATSLCTELKKQDASCFVVTR
ncbi:MAG: SPOR domain-containing protein [Geminicoccaceae bacterium]